MSDCIVPIKQALRRTADALQGKGINQHFICFDNESRDAAEMADVPMQRQFGTRIAAAFSRLEELLKLHGTPQHLDLVFVSDGEDTNCAAEMRGIPAPDCACRLLCVGVRSAFPTNLVMEHLFPKYGRGNDPCAAVVTPLEGGMEARWAFEQILGGLMETGMRRAPVLADFDEQTPNADLLEGAKRSFNACMHGWMFDRANDVEAGLRQCEDILRRVAGLCLYRVRQAKQAGHRLCILPSELLDGRREITPSAALAATHSLLSKVRECRNRGKHDAYLASLDQDARRNLAGFAAR